MKKTKTMKQKKNNIGFFQTCLLQDFQDIVSKKITDNRKQKTENGKQKKSILEKNRQDRLKQYVHFQIGFSFVCM